MKAVAPKNTSLKKLFVIWSALLVSFAAVEILARAAPLERIESQVEILFEERRQKLDRIEDGAILLLGDSTLGSDVDAAQLSQRLDAPVYNLGLVGNATTMGDWFVLNSAIATGKSIRAVVIMHTPTVWERQLDEQAYQLLSRRFGKLGLENLSREMSQQSSLVRQSKTYRTLLLADRVGFEPSKARVEASTKAATAARQALIDIDYIPPSARRNFDAQNPPPLVGFNVSDHVKNWFDETLELAAEHRIPVFVAAPPIWDRKAIVSRPFLDDQLAWLEKESRGGSRFKLLYPFNLTTENIHLGDKFEHLHEEAKRELFTPWFATRLERALKGEVGPMSPREAGVSLWDAFRDKPADEL